MDARIGRAPFAYYPTSMKDEDDEFERAIQMSLGICPQDAEASFEEPVANTNITSQTDEDADDCIRRGFEAAKRLDAIEAKLEVSRLARRMGQLDLQAIEKATADDAVIVSGLEATKREEAARSNATPATLTDVEAAYDPDILATLKAQQAAEKVLTQVDDILARVAANSKRHLATVKMAFVKMLLGENYPTNTPSSLYNATMVFVDDLIVEQIPNCEKLKVFFAANFEEMKPTLINPKNGDSRLHTLVRNFNDGNPFAFFILAELLRHGVDRTHKNNDGFMPINAASETNHEILDALFHLQSFEKENLLILATEFERYDLQEIIWRD